MIGTCSDTLRMAYACLHLLELREPVDYNDWPCVQEKRFPFPVMSSGSVLKNWSDTAEVEGVMEAWGVIVK